MLTQLDLMQFKCFAFLRLPFAPLTLLSGSNASGKSSVLQALVLLHQTMVEHEWSTRLMLNGESLRLGTVADIVDKVNGRRAFEVGATYRGRHYRWEFAGERGDMSMAVKRMAVDDSERDSPGILRYLLPLAHANDPFARRLRRLTYITAERIGPREVYPVEDPQAASVVGSYGQNTVSVLHWGREASVLPSLVLEGAPPIRLRQVEERMRTFFPGFGLALQQVPQANAVTLGLRISEDTDFHRPIHMGFGLTQLLPIVVAILSAERGDLVLIENPEVHLHPAGQAQVGQFLALAADAGVQIVLETHSDHVLNGIRRAVRAGSVAHGDVALHFFSPRDGRTAQVISPMIDQSGNLDAWPEGFFDQFDKDLSHFAGWGD